MLPVIPLRFRSNIWFLIQVHNVHFIVTFDIEKYWDGLIELPR